MKMATTALVQELLEGPLVKWICTVHLGEGKSLDYSDLTDGVLLHEVMLQIDPNPPHSGINYNPKDAPSRIRNISILLRNIKAFYEDTLGQLVVVKQPNPVTLGRDADSEEALQDMKMLLLLILGCAVQCDKKQDFIESIKQRDVETQHAIVECIQQVTDNPETIWTQDWNNLTLIPDEQQDTIYSILLQHLRRLVRERDVYAQQVTDLVLLSQDILEKSDQESEKPKDMKYDKHHMAVELADSKGKLRRLCQELEEKSEALSECKEEIEQNKSLLTKLRQENLELVQDARAAKAYRDELDIVRERAQKVDKLEAEIQRYKDKMNDIDFYKSRVDELREDNRILVETKEMLEEQLETSRKRAEHILELESEILRYKGQNNGLILERDADHDRIQSLIEENAQLQLNNKNSLSESAGLIAELDNLKVQQSGAGNGSLSEQLSNDAQAKVLKLELENQRLLSVIENFKESSFHESSEKILELEKENKRLSLKVSHLQVLGQQEKQQSLELEQEIQTVQLESKRLQDTLETVKANSDRQQMELQNEKQHLVELVETLRERQQKTTSQRLTDVEKENKRLVESTQSLQSSVSRLEYEKQQLTKLNHRLNESAERLEEVEHQNTELERENQDLKKAISAFKERCEHHEKLEEEHTSLEVEYKRLVKMLENKNQTCKKLESVQQENIKLSVENQKLSRIVETMKANAHRLADVEQEKEELRKVNQQLKNNLEALKVDHNKFEELDLKLMSVNNENQKLQRTLQSSVKKLEDIERENRDIENENQKLQKTIETLKVTTRKMNDLEKESTELEADNHKLDRENKSLIKEINRLKQAIEVKDSTVDECTSKASTFERENKRLNKELENITSQLTRLRDLEKENRELVQQSTVDKRTLCTLREDLVNEKVRTQQLNNELEKLTSELQKVGLNKEKLVAAEQMQGENRYKVLESMMEEALKKSLEIKDEKISTLESCLEESANRNATLKSDLRNVRQECEALKQRLKEEIAGSEKGPRDAATAREVLALKDHLVGVERENATLLAEIKNLKSQANSCQDQVISLQGQITSLQSQSTKLTQDSATLQSQNAKLQVENTTLQSQTASLVSQNSVLQTTNTQLEAEKDKLVKNQEHLQLIHEQLVRDQEALQKLHEQLQAEYDLLLQEREAMKFTQKDMKTEYKILMEKYQSVVSGQDDVRKLKEAVEAEKENIRCDAKSLMNLRAEHSRLKDDFRSLFTANEKLKNEYKNQQIDYKTLKTDNNSLKLKHTEIQGELADCHDQINSLDVEVTKLTNRCDVLQQMNLALEEDRKSLMSHVTLLLTQYHDLLSQTLEDKMHFHEEEKTFVDKLNNLRRQKEKLEEKIMEQYRRMENYSPKKRGFGANLVRRVRKAGTDFINKVPRTVRSRSCGRVQDGLDHTDSMDNSSLGSGSGGNESMDSGSDTRRNSPQELNRAHSANSVLGEKSFNSKNRLLASSHRKSLPPSVGSIDECDKGLRGSVSSEEIYCLKAQSNDGQQRDAESIESSVITNHLSNYGDNQSADISQSALSLGTVGSRRTVYYNDEDDTIPTRDVGPDPPRQRTSASLPDSELNKCGQSSGSSHGTSPSPTLCSLGSNSSIRSADPRLISTSEFSPIQRDSRNYVSMVTVHSNTITRTTHRNLERKGSLRGGTPQGPTWASNGEHIKEDVGSLSEGNEQTSRIQRPNNQANIPESVPPLPTRNRRSQSLLETSYSSQARVEATPQQSKDAFNASSSSPVPRPCLPPKPSNTSSNKAVAEGSSLDKSRDNLPKEVDNSIWYEYGCV